jgi:archaellum component FlaF (FlaF/FlaG flagellin family)
LKRLRCKGISKSAQKANKVLLCNVKEKVNKQVSNVKTQIPSKVDEVKQQLRQLGSPQLELAGVNIGRIKDTGTVGRKITTSSPKPSNSQPRKWLEYKAC